MVRVRDSMLKSVCATVLVCVCACGCAHRQKRKNATERNDEREGVRENVKKMRQRCKRDQEYSKDWQQSNGSRKDNKSLLAEMRCNVDTDIDDIDDDSDADPDGMEVKLPADLCRGINQQPALNDNSNATLL